MGTKRLSEFVFRFLRDLGSIVWVFVAQTLARLVPFAVVVLALVVFGATISVLLSVLAPLASPHN